jgi:hypothetical protein
MINSQERDSTVCVGSIQCMQGTLVAAFLCVRSMHIAAFAFRLGILNSERRG